MKKMILIAVVCAFVATPAFADLSGNGVPINGNSWSQTFNHWWTGNQFDLTAIKMMSLGDTFESVAIPWVNSGWSFVYENDATLPTIASVGGSTVNGNTGIQLNIKFPDPSSNPFVFDIASFDGNRLVGVDKATWSGSGWSFDKGTWNPTRAEVVPVPAAVLLGMLGLGAAGVKLRKFA